MERSLAGASQALGLVAGSDKRVTDGRADADQQGVPIRTPTQDGTCRNKGCHLMFQNFVLLCRKTQGTSGEIL